MRYVKPIDIEMINMHAQIHDYLVTLEEHAIQGATVSAVAEIRNVIRKIKRSSTTCS